MRGCLGQTEALEADVAELEIALAKRLNGSPERRLSVPASTSSLPPPSSPTSSTSAASPAPSIWSATSASNPRVSQPGNETACGGRISKQGTAEVRHVLSEAAWRCARVPGPLRGFYERIRADIGRPTRSRFNATRQTTAEPTAVNYRPLTPGPLL